MADVVARISGDLRAIKSLFAIHQRRSHYLLRQQQHAAAVACHTQVSEATMSDEIQRSLGQIEGKLDAFLTAIEQHFADDKVAFGTIDKRLHKLESKVHWFSGAGAVVGAAITFLLTGKWH